MGWRIRMLRQGINKVLRNVCIDRLRKPKTIPLSESEPIVIQPDGVEDLGRLEIMLTAGLTDIQRRIYTIVVKDGMEYEEIAVSLGMSVEAVRMNMSRARKRIRDNYKKLDR